MLLVFVVSTMRKLLEDPRNRTCMQNFAQNCFFPKMAPLFYSTIFSRLFVNSTIFFGINFRSRWYTWYMSLRGIYLHACMHITLTFNDVTHFVRCGVYQDVERWQGFLSCHPVPCGEHLGTRPQWGPHGVRGRPREQMNQQKNRQDLHAFFFL